MMGKYAIFGIIKSKYSSFMVHVRVRTKCDALQTQKWTWYHITMHTRLSRHVYLHTDFNGIRKCAWYALSEDDEFSQPEKHLPDMHRPPFPTTSTKKKLAWCWSSHVSVEHDEQREATFMLFILRTPSQQGLNKFVFNQRRLSNTPASPDLLLRLHSVFSTSPVFIVMSGQWLMRTLKHTIASLSVLVSGWWL